MRETFLPFHLPDIGEAEISSVVETLRSGWLTTGPKTKKFEEEFAKAVGAKHAVALNSCTAALHLALEATGVRAGDEVIVPAMTFAATAEVVLYLGATPVIVDVRPDTLDLDASIVERAITPKTKAIVPVDYAGQPCDIAAITALGRSRGIPVIEDAAHAFPAAAQGRPVGSIADVTCFSFYATKTITTGEGGMATTDNAVWADRMRMMSLHGISRDAWKRYTAQGSWYYEILDAGYKYNLTDVASAIGLEQLRRAEALRDARKRIVDRYDAAFADLPELRRHPRRPGTGHAWHLYVLRLDLERLRIGRDAFLDFMKERKIGCSVHFIPLHLHPLYRDRYGYRPEQLPTSTAAFRELVSLPLHTKMTDRDVEDVVSAVREGVLQNRR